jgi:hypothetical protein
MKSMMTAGVLCLVMGILVAAAPQAGAFGFGDTPNPWEKLDLKPVVGNWAEYRMTGQSEEPVTMRASIVGQEGDYFWFETVITGTDDEKVITKMLISGDPNQEDGFKRMIVKSGDQPAMEMPIQASKGPDMPGMAEPEMEAMEEPDVTSSDLGVDSVTVPAGTFEAEHWQFKSGDQSSDVWVKAGIGPYGLVKSSGEGMTMELLAYGEDATTLITEEPQSFPRQGFQIPGMGGE